MNHSEGGPPVSSQFGKFDHYYTLGMLRISLGLIFLWAFLDKLVGLGFATCREESGAVAAFCEKAWLTGGSPTEGFLTHATSGPLAPVYQSLAGNGFVDFLFMAGLLGLGIALTLGIGIKIATYSGVLLLLMMWSAALPPENNPIIDEHVVYGIALVTIYLANDRQRLGLGQWWRETALVRQAPYLE